MSSDRYYATEPTLARDANIVFVRLKEQAQGKKRKLIRLSQARERAREMLREADDGEVWMSGVVICWHPYSAEYTCHYYGAGDYKPNHIVETIR